MAIQSSLFPILADDSKTFTSTKHIPTKQHMAVWKLLVADNSWEQIPYEDFDLVTNTAVLALGLNVSDVSQVEIRVADSADELTTSRSDIAVVAQLKEQIEDIATEPLTSSIIDVAANESNISAVGSNLLTDDTIGTVAENIRDINTTADAINGGGSVSGGQFTGGGLTKPIMYTSKVVTEDTVISSGINALAIDSLTIEDGVTLTIEDDSVLKVV